VRTIRGGSSRTAVIVSAPQQPAEQGIHSARIAVVVNALLAVVKIGVGIFGHAYALVADGCESLADVFSSLAVWWGLHVSLQPADENHPQGHGKAEPLAALVVTIALFGAAVGIAVQAVHGIATPHLIPAPFTLLVLVGVICVKEALYRYVSRVSRDLESTAVRGDAAHQRGDVLVSAAAFVGISIAIVGARVHPGLRWETSDDWAALFASAIIAANGLAIGRSALYDLTDARPDGKIEASVRQVAARVPGVASLHKCTVRKSGFDYYVELDVRVDRNLLVWQGHEIAHAVQDAVRGRAAGGRIAQVLVHIEPTRAG
jgi:cation diffusion facilitator family transporter